MNGGAGLWGLLSAKNSKYSSGRKYAYSCHFYIIIRFF